MAVIGRSRLTQWTATNIVFSPSFLEKEGKKEGFDDDDDDDDKMASITATNLKPNHDRNVSTRNSKQFPSNEAMKPTINR